MAISSRSFRGLEFSEDFLLIGHFIFVPAHRRFYAPPGRSGSNNPEPAYSGSSPESRASGLFQNLYHSKSRRLIHKIIVCGLRLTLRAAALFIKA
ncbi:hypothetical protein T4B_1284 [Trichinella pseudospiralis]|uniref:Uncharacterized protein n=1 Tax=Trichinella pseudospiralis TaxID=6337 RepID=A0A0V1IG88_TRIPS|nr:hypothetical protein T4B_1284 [Trichinella pseudospiralis]